MDRARRDMAMRRHKDYAYRGRRDMRRKMGDRLSKRHRDYNYDMASHYGHIDRERSHIHHIDNYYEPDYTAENYMYERYGERDRHYEPYGMSGWRIEPYYDYSDGEDYLDEKELMDWAHDLMKDVDPKDKAFYSKDSVMQKAQQMNIQFDKFTPEELYVTTLMQYTDYKDVVGTSSPELFVAMAKAWLNDEDSELKQGEKLAVYYDEIICAD